MNVIAKTSCIEVGTERADDIPAEEHYAVIIVVDRAMDVVLQPSHPALAYESFETAPVTDGRLAPELEASVREAARNWIAGDPHPEKSTFSIPPSHIVRAQPLAGSNDLSEISGLLPFPPPGECEGIGLESHPAPNDLGARSGIARAGDLDHQSKAVE